MDTFLKNEINNNEDYNSDNKILFGDLNSTSLLTNDCYKKNIDLRKCDDKK